MRRNTPETDAEPLPQLSARPAQTDTFNLVARAQHGDAIALDALVTRYHPRVHRVVRRRMHTALRDFCDSLDITQQSFMHALRCFDRFEMHEKPSLMNWLAKIAERTILAMKDRMMAAKRPKLACGVCADAVDDAPEVPAEVVGREARPAVQRAVERLPAIQQEIIRLRYEEGWTWRRIAAQVGKPSADAARQTHRLALARLSADLGSWSDCG